MKSTVPVGTGRAVRHRLDDRGLENVGYVSNPEFTAEGTAVRDFMQPDRIVIGAFDDADGDVVEPRCTTGIDAPVVRADVASAEMIKLAANAALVTRISLHQRDRERLRGDRSGRAHGRRGHRARPSHRPALPPRGDRLRRLVLPEGLARAEAARRELGLQLPAPERRHRGERAAEAARHREARAATRPAPREADRAPRARVQAGNGRHARGAEPRARGRLLAEGAEVSAWDPVADGAAHLHGVEIAETAARRARRRGRRGDRDRVAGAAPRSTGPRRGSGCGTA